jgi:hypothetical protein
MVVTRSFAGDARVRPGAEVLSVNGVPASTILTRLLPLVRGDGSNDAKRVSLLEVQGRSRYEAFDVYFPLVSRPRPRASTSACALPAHAARRGSWWPGRPLRTVARR